MLTDANRKISIIAYYLSKFDKDAIRVLGYDTYSGAFAGISARFGKTNNYMKLRRDEFDALVSNVRQGWNKRKPTQDVLLMHEYLKNFSFEELSSIVMQLISDNDNNFEVPEISPEDKGIIAEYPEEYYEALINRTDMTATISKSSTPRSVRVYDYRIQDGLKRLYNFRCQICGATSIVMYGVDVSEAHHIEYFTKSMNNNPRNIIILCPDHHRIIHKGHAIFNYHTREFTYENAKVDKLMLNLHL